MMQEKERALRRRLQRDFIFYAEKCLKIRDKTGLVRPFELNAAQRHIHAEIERQREKTGKVRAVILKGRQQGCSTYAEARFYWQVTHRRGVQAFILTHLEEASKNIYQIARRFHDNCPSRVRPQTSVMSARALYFDKLDSGYSVGTARSQGTGRSSTIQYFHGSEVAYWPNAREHFAGVMQAVADAPGTEVILESTSAGASGFFYDLCQSAIKGQGDYIFIFVPWFWQDEYRKDPSGFEPNAEEQSFAELHGLDTAQLCWRRAKMLELGGLHAFRREYPATAEEAFAADHPQALWSRAIIEKNRLPQEAVPDLTRVIIAVDPATTSHGGSDETGIIAAGLCARDHAYVLEDASGRYKPGLWASVVLRLFARYSADCVVAETNQGGEMVEYTLRSIDPLVPIRGVHASRGKQARAAPVAALDYQGRIHHAGFFPALEDQMCSFGEGGKSPDRVDARVWAMTDLLLMRPKTGGPRIWQL